MLLHVLSHCPFPCRYIARINWSAQVAAAADRTRRKSDELTGQCVFACCWPSPSNFDHALRCRRLHSAPSYLAMLDVTRCAGVALPGAAAVELEGMDSDGDKLLNGAAMRSDDA